MPAQITCRQCGTTITVPPSRVGRTVYCSRACYSAWMAANLTGEKAARWQKTHTPETKAKIAAAQKAKGRTGERSAVWKGGTYRNRGYVYVRQRALTQPELTMFASMLIGRPGEAYIPEHRLVVARREGRPLTPAESVHHINGVKHDNRPENLALHSPGSHARLHAEVNRELLALRRENALLRAELSKFCDVTSLLAGSTTSSPPAA